MPEPVREPDIAGALPGAAIDAALTEGPARNLFGLIRLSGLCLAIPVAAIREVIPFPERLDPFPATRPDVIGAIDLRGQLIPVLDLSQALASDGAGDGAMATATSIAVILRHGASVFGVLAEGIEGVCAVDGHAIDPVAIVKGASARPLLRATFHLGERRGVMVDIDAVASLPGLPLVDDRTGQRNRLRSGDEPTLIFTVGEVRCALPTGCVDATVPWQDMAPAPVEDGLWMAMLPYKGAEIPVVDTVALLGHGSLPPGRRSGAAVVLRTGAAGEQHGGGLVALLIDSVDDIVRASADAIMALPQGTPGTAHALGLLQRDSGACLLLCAQSLIGDPRLNQLGGIEQRAEAAATARDEPGARASPGGVRKPYLVFSLEGGDFAVPLEMVDEILPAGQDIVPLPNGGHGIIGLFSRRKLAIPVIDMGLKLGFPATREDGFVVVIRFARNGETLRAGFRVNALCSVERAVARQLDRADTGARSGLTQMGMLGHTIRLESGHACCVLDLAEMARTITASGI